MQQNRYLDLPETRITEKAAEIPERLKNNRETLMDASANCFCFVALRPKSTAMVMAGRSVDFTTLFSWASLNKQLTGRGKICIYR